MGQLEPKVHKAAGIAQKVGLGWAEQQGQKHVINHGVQQDPGCVYQELNLKWEVAQVRGIRAPFGSKWRQGPPFVFAKNLRLSSSGGSESSNQKPTLDLVALHPACPNRVRRPPEARRTPKTADNTWRHIRLLLKCKRLRGRLYAYSRSKGCALHKYS